MTLRKYDPNLLDDITAVAERRTDDVLFVCEVLCLIRAEARKGRASGSGAVKHFALKEVEALCATALVRAGVKR